MTVRENPRVLVSVLVAELFGLLAGMDHRFDLPAVAHQNRGNRRVIRLLEKSLLN